ncbi:MAG: ABC transporter substrate-binding protein, partial [Stellaceae bacterium]
MMHLWLTRRSLLAATALAPIAARARTDLQKIRFGFAAKAISPIIINILIPERLGYYREEGLTVDAIPLGSDAAVMGSLQEKRIEFGPTIATYEIPIVARGGKLPLIDFYEFTYPFKWALAVKPDSPAKTLTDLKGKRIGVSSFGMADFPVGSEVFQLAGIDPKKDISWLAVGAGVTAGEALVRGDIDALFYFDTGFGTIEAAGIKLRYLRLPDDVPKIGGIYLAATRKLLADRRAWAVGLARGVAKASIFILTNPEA